MCIEPFRRCHMMAELRGGIKDNVVSQDDEPQFLKRGQDTEGGC
jgi:hypothetical protein